MPPVYSSPPEVRWVPAAVIAVLLVGCGGDPQEHPGKLIADSRGCFSCHSTDGSSNVGPTWRRLYGSKVELDDGTAVVAGDAYLSESMLQPSAKTVKGFEKGAMETVISPNSLSRDEVKKLIAYIKTLK